jgi:hypothetical protein
MTDPSQLVAEAERELRRLLPALDALLADLDPVAWRTRPAPDEWSPVEIVCHLRDEETEDFGARIGVILAGGDRFVPSDPEGWAVERRYRESDPRSALETLRRHRAASVELLASIAPDRIARAVAHPRAGRLSGLDLLAAWVAHDRLHLAQLAATLARLWAERWTPLRADYAGPIPYGPGPAG